MRGRVKPKSLAELVMGPAAAELEKCETLEREVWREFYARAIDADTRDQWLEVLEVRKEKATAKLDKLAPVRGLQQRTQVEEVRPRREWNPNKLLMFIAFLVIFFVWRG